MPKSLPPDHFHFMSGPQPHSHLMMTALQDDRFTEHAAWIGIITGLWSLIEQQLAFIYGDVLGMHHEQSQIAFYAIQNYNTKRNTLSAAIAHYHAGSDIEAEWIDLQEPLKKAHGYRNTVAHAIWERHPKTGNLRMQSTIVDGLYVRKYKQFPANNLRSQALELSALCARLNTFAIKTHGARTP